MPTERQVVIKTTADRVSPRSKRGSGRCIPTTCPSCSCCEAEASAPTAPGSATRASPATPPSPRRSVTTQGLRQIVEQILASSIPTEMRISPSVIPSAARRSAGHRGVGHDRRVGDERLDAAEAFGQRHQPAPAQHLAGAVERADVEGHQPAEALHLPRRQGMVRVAGQARDRWCGSPAGARPGTRRCAWCWRWCAPSGSAASWCRGAPASVHRTEDGAGGILDEAQPVLVVLVGDDDDAADAVAVAVQELGGAVQHDVGAQGQRAAARRGWRRCCRPPPARRGGARSSLAAAMSVIDSIGLVGDSMNRYFVLAVKAGAMASSREVST